MPTPYGSRGGMAFTADEVRVLRRALAAALRPVPHGRAPAGSGTSGSGRPGSGGDGQRDARVVSPSRAAEVRAYAQLADAVEEADREGARMRAFQRADLARYRAALPGSAPSYAACLSDAVADGYLPRPADLAALRTLPALAVSRREAERRHALRRRCERLAESALRARLLRPRREGTLPA